MGDTMVTFGAKYSAPFFYFFSLAPVIFFSRKVWAGLAQTLYPPPGIEVFVHYKSMY